MDECKAPAVNTTPITFPGDPTHSSSDTERQGLTLVHFSAQPEPFLTKNTPYSYAPHNTPRHLLNTPYTTPKCTSFHTHRERLR